MTKQFLLLLRGRLRALANGVRFATLAQRGWLLLFAVSGAALFVGIGAVGVLLLTAAGQAGGQFATDAFVHQVVLYLFLFLLGSGLPFISSTLFAPSDLPLLAAAPVRTSVIVLARLVDATIAASGQFAVLGLPLLLACAWAANPNGWGLLTGLLLVPFFLLLPTLLISALLLTVVRVIGLRSVRWAVSIVSALFSVALCLLTVGEVSRRANGGGLTLQSFAQTAPVHNNAPIYLPSTWFGNVLVAVGHGAVLDALAWFAVVVLATCAVGAVCVRLGATILAGESLLEQNGGTASLSRLRLTTLIGLLPLQQSTQALFAKDCRYLVRDLVMLSQVGIPLILYGVPLVVGGPVRLNGASTDDVLLLALGVVATIVYMETSILSISSVGLEGRGYWMLRAAPITAQQFLRAKWAWAFTLALLLCIPLYGGAVLLFRAAPLLSWAGLGLLIVACATLCGLGVGVAGVFPRFVYENPAYRASLPALIWGFLGASGYILLSAGTLVGSWLLAQQWPERGTAILTTGGGMFLLLSLLTGWLPLVLARARLANYAWEH